MTLGALVAVAVAVAALGWMFAPLLRRGETLPPAAGDAANDARDLMAQREMVFSSLRDLEDDHQTGKIDQADYDDLKARLTGQAAGILKRLDEARDEADREAIRPTLRPVGGSRREAPAGPEE